MIFYLLAFGVTVYFGGFLCLDGDAVSEASLSGELSIDP